MDDKAVASLKSKIPNPINYLYSLTRLFAWHCVYAPTALSYNTHSRRVNGLRLQLSPGYGCHSRLRLCICVSGVKRVSRRAAIRELSRRRRLVWLRPIVIARRWAKLWAYGNDSYAAVSRWHFYCSTLYAFRCPRGRCTANTLFSYSNGASRSNVCISLYIARGLYICTQWAIHVSPFSWLILLPAKELDFFISRAQSLYPYIFYSAKLSQTLEL